MKRSIYRILLILMPALLSASVSSYAQTSLTSISGNLAGGSYILAADITVDKEIFISGTVELDLNGHVLQLISSKWGRLFNVQDGAVFTIKDSNPSRSNTGPFGLKGVSGSVVEAGAQETISGGVMMAYGADRGGIMFMAPGSTVYFNGGTMTGGVAMRGGYNDGDSSYPFHAYTDGCGGAVYVNENCRFVMNGGKIANCRTKYVDYSGDQVYSGKGGAVFVDAEGVSPGVFEMRGTSSISGCQATRGGGVYVYSAPNVSGGACGSFIMEGGRIERCLGSRVGGGVMVTSGSRFDMSGGTIYNCRTTTQSEWFGGAGVFVNANSEQFAEDAGVLGTFNMTGGTITANQTAARGCGVHTKGIVNVSGSASISGNYPRDYTFPTPDAYSGTVVGGGIYSCFASAKVTITSGTVYNNVAAVGAGVYVDTQSSCVMSGGNINGNRALWSSTSGFGGNYGGGGVYVCMTGSFKLAGGAVKDNLTTKRGSGVNSHGKFEMTGGQISGNYPFGYAWDGVYGNEGGYNDPVIGGGVYLYNSTSSFTMSAGTISGNIASSGGGIYVGPSATATCSGGYIEENLALRNVKNEYNAGGGGIYVCDSGTFNLSGGTIRRNKALSSGAGVNSKGVVNMSSGLITENVPYDWNGDPDVYVREGESNGDTYGGGVFTYTATSVFNMTGGSITNNVSASGGGVMVWTNSRFNMSDTSSPASINGNSALGQGGLGNGGAVYVQSATFIFDGGTMGGNKAVRYGGAVNINESATLELNAGTVSGNTANYGGGVSQEQGECSMVINPDITMSGNTAVYDGGGVFIEMGTLILDGCTISGNRATGGNGGGVSLKAARVQGSIDVSIRNEAKISENVAGKSGGGIDIYLSPNGTWTQPQTVDVDFASGDVTDNQAAVGGALHIYANETWGTASMTVGSASSTPEFSDNLATGNSGYGGAIAMENGTMDILAGTFVRNRATGSGGYGGAVVLNGGNMNITEAEFSQNSAFDKGGCIYVAGSLDVTGRIVIKDNIAGNEAGAVLVDGGNLDIADCEISGNKAGYDAEGNPLTGSAACGGALSIRGGSVNISKGEIVGNISTLYGGGLYVYNDTGSQKSVNLLGNGVFRGNRAVAGGGIYVAGDVVMNMEGDVDDNLAGYYGGGLYLEHVTRLNFEGNVSFNKAKNGGGIFLNASNMVITGGIIRNNRAVPDPYNPADVTGSVKPSTGYLVNPLLMVGSLDFVGVGGGLYLNSGSNLQFDIQDDLGVYENDATWGADDIFANGDGTSVKIPDVADMNLTGYRVPTTRLYWAEDYITADSEYENGTALGLLANPGADFKSYRYDDAILDSKTVYTLDFEGADYMTIDKYLSLEVGYELIVVDMVKKGLKIGESASFVITPAKKASGTSFVVADGEEPYITVMFVCVTQDQDVRRRVVVPSGWWEFKETTWSWAYDNAETIIRDVSRETQQEAGGKLEYIFVNVRKDTDALPEDIPETYEAVKINRMKSTKTVGSH